MKELNPTINLMRRIHTTDFLSLSEDQQLEQITALQQRRLDAIAAARATKNGTKSAAKNRARTAKGRSSVKSDQDKLAKLLVSLPPEKLAALKQSLK